jgi:isopentenyl-diphosphate delta-isomerase
MTDQTSQRKRDHLQPFRQGGVGARSATTLLECVLLEHRALPELAEDELELGAELAGHRFAAPLFITGMTGGTAEAAAINCALARVAERLGIGFGLGSQRAMPEDPSLAAGYDVRAAAPRVFVAGNIGAVQLRRLAPSAVRDMLDRVGANALCVHLNAAQEMMQPEGDRDFRGLGDAIGRVVQELDRPVIVKETGAGISRAVGLELGRLGVRHLDVAGAGGTSWVGVELQRAGREAETEGLAFWDWGVPTAASLVGLADSGLELIGSGGIRTGLDVARAIALGARLCGMAGPVIGAYFQGGEQAAEQLLRGVLRGLRTAMLLTGSRTLGELRAAPRRIAPPLADWLT